MARGGAEPSPSHSPIHSEDRNVVVDTVTLRVRTQRMTYGARTCPVFTYAQALLEEPLGLASEGRVLHAVDAGNPFVNESFQASKL